MQTTIQLTFATAAAAAAFLATVPADGVVNQVAVTPAAGNAKATTPATTPEVRYFHNAASDTIFELKKGDKPPAGASGSTNISQHEYEGHKARLAEKYRALQTAAASGAASAASSTTAAAAVEFDPFADEAAAVTEVDEPTLVGKLQELAKFPTDGRALLMSWIERAGAKGVPAMVKAMNGAQRGQMFADANKHMGIA